MQKLDVNSVSGMSYPDQPGEHSLQSIQEHLDENIQALRAQILKDSVHISQREVLGVAFREGRRLVYLNLDNLSCTDEDLQDLALLCPNLRDLSLKNSKITTVKPFLALKNLESLDLQGCTSFQNVDDLLAANPLCRIVESSFVGSQDVDESTLQLALKILTQVGNFPWKIENGYLSCDTELVVLPTEGHLYQETANIFSSRVKEMVGIKLKNICLYLEDPQSRKVSVRITDAEQIRKLADLTNPQVILIDPKTKMPRSLSSIAATLCILIPEGYSKKTLDLHGPTPDIKLPFPLIDISNEGFTIKLPEALSVEFSTSLQDIIGKEPISITESNFGKNYVVKFTLSLEEVRAFLQDKLGLTTVPYTQSQQIPIIEDIIRARTGTRGELNEAIKSKLRGK